jgi:hypothetical protein
MTKAELMFYVGKKVYIYFKGGESGIYGTLGYADDFSAKHDWRKPDYFYIGNTSFKVSHVRKLAESEKTDADSD